MLMLTTVLVAGMATMPPPAHPRKPEILPCPSIEVLKADALRPPRKPVFSARQVGDLEFVLTSSHKLAGQQVQLKLLTPSGHLYQTLNGTLAAPRHRHHSAETRLRLPVSGTLIERSSLYGNWHAELLLDGSTTACRRPLSFTLNR